MLWPSFPWWLLHSLLPLDAIGNLGRMPKARDSVTLTQQAGPQVRLGGRAHVWSPRELLSRGESPVPWRKKPYSVNTREGTGDVTHTGPVPWVSYAPSFLILLHGTE